jgi:site-specific DNA-methyltransferase (adenine-specific)
LYYGDNLEVMQKFLPDDSVDLVYLDPPFATNRTHVFTLRDGRGEDIEARAVAFQDKWEWNLQAQESCERITCGPDAQFADAFRALQLALGPCALLAYLVHSGMRLHEVRRVLRPTGSLYLHCDYRTVHYMRLVCDALFGESGFRNEIIWHYTGGGRSKNYFSRKHDTILFYTMSDSYTFNVDAIRVPYKETSGYARAGIVSAAGRTYLPHPDGTPADDVWDIPIVNPMSRERTGYPTQKPLALLERIVTASSNESDLVLDPYCGSGTALAACAGHNRRWVGIDSSEIALTATRCRLESRFPGMSFEVVGEPLDLRRAAELLDENDVELLRQEREGVRGQVPCRSESTLFETSRGG